MKSFFGLSLVFVFATICHGQVVSSSVLRSDDLQEDVVVLRSAYEQLHPGLYRYNSKAKMDKDFAALSRQLDHGQSL